MSQSIQLQLKDYTENVEFVSHLQLKPKHQTTTKCPFLLAPQLDFHSCIHSQTDLSFQVEMHRENADAIKVAAMKYLQECLMGGYSIQLGFKDASLYVYKQHESDIKEECFLDYLIGQNDLFSDDMKKELYYMLKEQDGLARFFRQIAEVFGLTVGKQMVFLVYRILKQKYHKYKLQFNNASQIIPKFSCYQDLNQEGCESINNQCSSQEEVDLEEVLSFAEDQIEEIASKLYFANIKILNLKHITAEINPRADLYQEFATLIKRISKSTFLTLAGAIEPSNQICSLFDIPQEFSLKEIEEQELSIHKSMSRASMPVDYEEEGYSLSSKKVKLQ